MGMISIIVFVFTVSAEAGPYTEAGVNGYIGNDWRHADPDDEDAILNPIFRGWATGFGDYFPSDDDLTDYYGVYDLNDPHKALGPVAGWIYDVVSLGDLDPGEIADGCAPGQITLAFGDPYNSSDPNHISDVNGFDFVVFENAFLSLATYPGGGSIAGEMFAELGYVEVSSDGVNFARFPSVSLTSAVTGEYGTIEISNIFNLVGKHPNAGGVCTGTPFDLNEIVNEPNVVSGLVDINDISYVRIVDIPGSGDFYDEAVKYVDPDSRPDWDYYDTNHPIYDAWVTSLPGGVDLEAIGVLHPQEFAGDINLDGIVNYDDLLILTSAWLKQFGQDGWVPRCDLAEPKDYIINMLDYAVFTNQWLGKEMWRD